MAPASEGALLNIHYYYYYYYHVTEFESLPGVYTRNASPIDRSYIATTVDVARWPYINGVVLPEVGDWNWFASGKRCFRSLRAADNDNDKQLEILYRMSLSRDFPEHDRDEKKEPSHQDRTTTEKYAK